MTSSNRHHGIVLVWVVVLMTVFLGFVGLAIDSWYVGYTAQQLQVAADAAALAGATYVRDDQDEARLRAQSIAASNNAGGAPLSLTLNSGNNPDGDIVIGRFVTETGEFIVTDEDVNAVRVNARRSAGSTTGPLNLFFGPAFGVDTAGPTRTATAIVGGELHLGALILARLGPCAFEMRGTAANMVVNNGAIYVNSGDAGAACNTGHPSVTADEILIHGGFDAGFDTEVTYEGEIFTGVNEIEDPLITLPEPNRPLLPGINITLNANATLPLVPGYYRDVTVTNGTLLLAPGLYYIDGVFRVNGGNLTGNNVMIFIGPNGSLDFSGNGNINLSAMNTMVYAAGPSIPVSMRDERVILFQSRGNTRTAEINGTGTFNLDGRIYMPENGLEVGGSGKALGTGLIVGTLEIYGNGNFIVDADPFIIPRVEFVYLVR